MATNYDVHFLRILVEQRRVNADQARQCLTWIDAAQAPAPTAYQMAVQRGLVDAGVARVTHVRVMAHFKESGERVSLVSSEAAKRTVSGEGGVAGERPKAPTGNYFDLSAAGDNLEGYALGPLVAQGPCYSEFHGSGPHGAARILTLSPRFDEHPVLLKDVTQELRAWLGFRHAHGSGPERLGRTHARDGRPSQLVVAYPATAGQTLSEFVAEHGAVEADEALDAVLDACDLLAAAHPKGLRVGDVRSGNLVFDGERSRFRDLGLARAHSVAGGFARYGVPFGDPSYLAPEVIQEQVARPTAASDVYALGILFYELICGRLPFVGSPAGILEAHLSDALPPPPVDVDFSSVTAGVVLRMTAKAAEERAQDAVTLLAALRDFRAGRPFRIVVGPPELPSGAGPISADEWSEASNKRAAQGAQDWTESMIDRAPIVGPSDLEPLASGVIFPSDQRLSGRLPRRLLQLSSEFDAPISEADRPGADLSSQSDHVVSDSADRLDAFSSDRLEPVAESPARAPAPKPAPAPEPPVRIGDKLGRGAIGATYLGKAQDHPDPVVLKVVSRKFAQHPEILETIRTDVSAALTLRHVNVVPVLDMIQTEGREVIVSERSSGTVLRELLKGQRRLPIDEALALVRDIARALEAGVRAGFSHGDVRPEKIYVEDTRARLADFGHARGACLGAGLGKYGMSFGHPFYLAPEILQKRLTQPTLQTDLYALGVVFYEALCGARPFNEPGIKKNLLAHLKTPVPAPPRDVSLPQSLADALLRMTAKDPGERYASVEEFMDTLDGCLEASMASADLMSDASGASASAFTVEEFDPTASATGELARAAWGERSQEAARPRAGWSKTKLREAEKAGPEWSSDDGEAAGKDQLYKDLERGGAAVRSGPGKRRSSVTGSAGKASSAEQTRRKGKSKVPLLAGGLLLCVALVGGGLALGGKDSGIKGPSASPSSGGKVRPDPSAAASKARAAEETAQEAARQAIATYEERGGTLLRAEDHEALGKLKTECFPGRLMSRPEVRKAVAAFEAKVKDARAKRFLAAKRIYDAALARGDLKAAEGALAKLPADAAANALRQKVGSALEREEREFDVFANTSKRSADRLERLLERNLRGWEAGGGRAYESGGVIVSYRKAALLLQDLQVLRGAAPKAGSRGLALVGGRRNPGVFAWKPSLSGVLGLTAVLSLEQGARFAFVFGLNKAGLGKGVSLPDGTPVALGRRELGGAKAVSGPTDLKVELRFAPQGAQVVASVTVQTKSSTRTTVSFARSDLQGGLGLAVHGKAWVRSLRIEGVVDPTYR